MMQPQQQSQPPHHHKGTPGRRRQNRQSTNSPASRTYASENDMADVPFPMDFGGTPHTPQKSASNSPAPNSQAAHQKSRPRNNNNNNNNNKNRPKNVSTSPKPTKQGRTTPPYTTGPKSATAAAFAGSTFHASPAPSSLPIPSFLAKPLDSPGRKEDPGRVSQEPSPPPTDSEAPTPQRFPSTSHVAREESPLDFFFRADRAEKEKARWTNSANTTGSVPATVGPFSPPVQPLSPRELRAVPNGAATDPARRPAILRNASGGISTTELDGNPGKPMGPAFSTPYQDRIRAARSSEKPQSVSPQQTAAPVDRTDALKKFLAIGSPSPANRLQHPSSLGRPGFPATGQAAGPTVAQVQQISVSSTMTATTSTMRADTARSPDLLHMENSLRQILKLDSTLNLGATPATNYRSS